MSESCFRSKVTSNPFLCSFNVRIGKQKCGESSMFFSLSPYMTRNDSKLKNIYSIVSSILCNFVGLNFNWIHINYLTTNKMNRKCQTYRQTSYYIFPKVLDTISNLEKIQKIFVFQEINDSLCKDLIFVKCVRSFICHFLVALFRVTTQPKDISTQVCP